MENKITYTLNRQEINLCKIFTTLIILSCSPFFVIGGISTLLNVSVFSIFVVLYIIVTHLNRFNNPSLITKKNYSILIVSLLFFLTIFFPFRIYDKFVAVAIWPVSFLMLLFLNDSIPKIIAHFFSWIIFVISLLGILNWFLLLFGFNIPYYEYNTGLVGVIKSKYFLYPGTVVLQGQNFDIFGRSVFRMSGIFAEPGHFGIISFFAYLLSSSLSKFQRSVILIASLLSFSMGTYVLWLGYVLIDSGVSIAIKLRYIIILCLLSVIGYYLLPQEVLDRFILNKIGADSTLDNRTGYKFIQFFNKKHDFSEVIFGYGRLVFDEFDLSNSDYRGYFLRYGILGLVCYLLWVCSLAYTGLRKNTLLVIFIAVVILAHRAWLIDYLVLYFVLFYLSKEERK